MDDGFVLVTGKKAGKRRRWNGKLGERHVDGDTAKRLKATLEEMVKELQVSQFFSDFKCESERDCLPHLYKWHCILID